MPSSRNRFRISVKKEVDSMDFLKINESVMHVYQTLEIERLRFLQMTGLYCLPRCGNCCNSKELSAAIIECIPAAIYLWNSGNGDEFYTKLEQSDPSNGCCFFTPSSSRETGICSLYQYRFLVCRLFANTVQINSHGEPQLITCQRIKAARAAEYAEAIQSLRQGLPAPIARNFRMQLYGIEPALGSTIYPLHTAMMHALEITYWHFGPHHYHFRPLDASSGKKIS
jgi:Fe-S-cluster containining protein